MTGAGGHRELSWRLLGEPDFPALTELARECLSADGGQPFAASPGFLGRCYLSGAQTYAGFSGTRLACVSSLRLAPAVTTGLVHPAWRRRGIGGYALDWAGDRAGPAGPVAAGRPGPAAARAPARRPDPG
jgi:mycothiol synthase